MFIPAQLCKAWTAVRLDSGNTYIVLYPLILSFIFCHPSSHLVKKAKFQESVAHCFTTSVEKKLLI